MNKFYYVFSLMVAFIIGAVFGILSIRTLLLPNIVQEKNVSVVPKEVSDISSVSVTTTLAGILHSSNTEIHKFEHTQFGTYIVELRKETSIIGGKLDDSEQNEAVLWHVDTTTQDAVQFGDYYSPVRICNEVTWNIENNVVMVEHMQSPCEAGFQKTYYKYTLSDTSLGVSEPTIVMYDSFVGKAEVEFKSSGLENLHISLLTKGECESIETGLGEYTYKDTLSVLGIVINGKTFSVPTQYVTACTRGYGDAEKLPQLQGVQLDEDELRVFLPEKHTVRIIEDRDIDVGYRLEWEG